MDALERRVKALEGVIESIAPGSLSRIAEKTEKTAAEQQQDITTGRTPPGIPAIAGGSAARETCDSDRLVVERIKHILGISSDEATSASAPGSAPAPTSAPGSAQAPASARSHAPAQAQAPGSAPGSAQVTAYARARQVMRSL